MNLRKTQVEISMKFNSNRRPGKTSNSRKYLLFGRFTILLCGSVLVGAAQTAEAAHGDRPTLREFRNQHADLTHREVHRLFHATYNTPSVGGTSGSSSSPIKSGSDKGNLANWHHIVREENSVNQINHHEAKLLRGGIQQVGDNVVRLGSGVNLDLSSSDKNIVLGENLFESAGSVEIMLGSEKQTFTAGSKATASEYIAIKQALSSDSGQKLIINESGIASGGSVDLTQITGDNDPMRAANLIVSSGVTTYGDFGKHSDFVLKGDLNNYGTIVALSSSNSVRAGAIRADDITNNAGASITTVLPDSLTHSNFASKVDLTLNARGDITNNGMIASNGNLTLAAGNAISNNGTISATDSANMAAPTINNSGLIAALNRDINIDGPSTSALNVNNNQGTLSALQGAINVRTPDYSGAFDNRITGGNLFSKTLNINGGNATNYVNVNELTGTVSQTGLAGHILASTDNLQLGSTCLTGDPTFFNSAGAITINSNVVVGEALTIIASGNIVKNTGVDLEARTATGGFDLTLIAGANFVSTTGGSDTSTLPNPSAAGSVTIDGTASTTGGSIILGTGTIITSPSGGTGNGGNVSMFAFKGSASKSGMMDINAASIVTGGAGTGTNGNVKIIAGGNDDNFLGLAIQIGAINTTGGTGGGGDLKIVTSQPKSSSGGNIVYLADGSLSGVASLVEDVTLNSNSSIGQSGGQAKVAGNVIMSAGKDIVQASTTDTLFTDNLNSNVTLTVGGNIGADIFFPFIIEGLNDKINNKFLKLHGGSAGDNNLTVTANGAGSTVNILRNATTTLNLLASSSTKNFVLRTNSILNVAGNITSTGAKVQLENTGGALNIKPNIVITAFDAIDIANGSKKKPTLNLGANAILQTTATGGPASGDIFLTVDPKAFSLSVVGFAAAGRKPIPSPHVNGAPTKPLSEAEGFGIIFEELGPSPELIQYSGKVPAFSAPPINTFTSNNATILLTNAKNNGMTFGGGVSVTAGQ